MPRVDEPTTRPGFVLGGAQLGHAYGIANLSGMLSDEDALKLIGFAIQSGVRFIDTARAYGPSEHRVGLALAVHGRDALEVVTKLDPLGDVDAETSQEVALEAARRSLSASLSNLADDRIETLLLHRPIIAAVGMVTHNWYRCRGGKLGNVKPTLTGGLGYATLAL